MSFNAHTIVGYVAEPEIRYSKADKAIASLRLATVSSFKDADGNKQERTTWHTVKVFGKLADVVKDHVKKGDLLLITGEVNEDEYTDKDGVKRHARFIVADTLKMLGAKKAQDG